MVKKGKCLSQHRNVIFLDMDGVINHSTESGMNMSLSMNEGIHTIGSYWSSENIPPFLLLIKCMRELDYCFVISSTWRFGVSAEQFNEYFRHFFPLVNRIFGSKLLVVGTTGFDAQMHRGKEIEEYIKSNQVINYICIDDDITDILENIPKRNVVHCKNKKGLTYWKVLKIVWKMWRKI